MKVHFFYIYFNCKCKNYFDLSINDKINWKQKSGFSIFYEMNFGKTDDLPF